MGSEPEPRPSSIGSEAVTKPVLHASHQRPLAPAACPPAAGASSCRTAVRDQAVPRPTNASHTKPHRPPILDIPLPPSQVLPPPQPTASSAAPGVLPVATMATAPAQADTDAAILFPTARREALSCTRSGFVADHAAMWEQGAPVRRMPAGATFRETLRARSREHGTSAIASHQSVEARHDDFSSDGGSGRVCDPPARAVPNSARMLGRASFEELRTAFHHERAGNGAMNGAMETAMSQKPDSAGASDLALSGLQA